MLIDTGDFLRMRSRVTALLFSDLEGYVWIWSDVKWLGSNLCGEIPWWQFLALPRGMALCQALFMWAVGLINTMSRGGAESAAEWQLTSATLRQVKQHPLTYRWEAEMTWDDCCFQGAGDAEEGWTNLACTLLRFKLFWFGELQLFNKKKTPRLQLRVLNISQWHPQGSSLNWNFCRFAGVLDIFGFEAPCFSIFLSCYCALGQWTRQGWTKRRGRPVSVSRRNMMNRDLFVETWWDLSVDVYRWCYH